MTHLPDHWREKVYVDLSIPGWRDGHFYHEIMRFFQAWEQSEGGGAEFDPLNTTDHLHDSFGSWQGTDWNSIGVANFTTAFHGITATSATLLENSVFSGLVDYLRTAEAKGRTAEDIVNANASAIRTWGTSPSTILSVLKSIS